MKRIGDRIKYGDRYGKIIDSSEPLVFTIVVDCTAGNPDGEQISVPGYAIQKLVNARNDNG